MEAKLHMDNNYHGLGGTLVTLMLCIYGKVFTMIVFLSITIAGFQLHDILSNLSLFGAICVASVTVLNNVEKSVNNINKWYNIIFLKYKQASITEKFIVLLFGVFITIVLLLILLLK